MPGNAGVLLGKMPRLDVLLPQLSRSLSATEIADAHAKTAEERQREKEIAQRSRSINVACSYYRGCST